MAKIKEEVQGTFTLPKKIITLKFIPRTSPLAPDADTNHVAYGGMLTGATSKFAAPLQRNGTIKNVLTNEEKDYLENATGLDLSIYGEFWNNFYVTLRKDESSNKLHLDNPNDYISYKILMAYDKSAIAPSWSQKDRLISYKFAITEEDEITAVVNNSFNTKKEAFKVYAKFENNYDTLINILRLLESKPISPNTSINVIQRKVSSYVDNEPAKFLSVALDAKFETKALLNEAVALGIVKKTGTRHVTADGLELCEAGEQPIYMNAVNFLDAPKNQDIKSLIEAKLLKAKK